MANLITAVRQASDIMNDGAQVSTKTCNGISIGLGVEMAQAKRGDVGPVTAVSQACPTLSLSKVGRMLCRPAA